MANPILGTSLMAVPVTALYGAVSAFLVTALGMNVSRLRGKYKTFRGDGGHDELQWAIRVHGNTVEHVPMLLLMLLIAELGGGSSIALHVFGGALVVSRLVYAAGFFTKKPVLQFPGALSTYVLEAALAVYVLILRPWS